MSSTTMSEKTIIVSQGLLDKLVCKLCKNYLSIFPVLTNVNDTIGICGRCTVTDPCYVRDEPYEYIAQYLSFPCCYMKNGCPEINVPYELEDHEKVCIFKDLDCPTKSLSKCQWKGQQSELKDHYKDRHSRLLMKDDGVFKFDFSKNFKEVALLPAGGELFIVNREVNTDTKLFTCCVTHLKCNNVIKGYKYFLTISSNNGELSSRFPTYNMGDTVTLDGVVINEKLPNVNIIVVKIEIFELDKDELFEKVDIKGDEVINWDLLHELKCSTCKEFMLPPIYRCHNRHSFCGACKPNRCPVCQKAFITENVSLMTIAKHVVYPCRYYTDGCKHFGKPPKIIMHQNSCEYGLHNCLLSESANCPWLSHFSRIAPHIERDHADSILKCDRVDVPHKDILVDFDEKFYVIIFSERAFKVHYKFEKKRFYWAVQFAGPLEECRKYRVEIDIVDSSENNLKRHMRGLCVPVTANELSFHDCRKYMTISLEDIEPLIIKWFNYIIRIVPVENKTLT